MQAKQGLYDFPALYCRYGGATRTFGNDEEYDENPLNVESTLMQIVLGELWQYTAIGSGLVTNVLYCVGKYEEGGVGGYEVCRGANKSMTL